MRFCPDVIWPISYVFTHTKTARLNPELQTELIPKCNAYTIKATCTTGLIISITISFVRSNLAYSEIFNRKIPVFFHKHFLELGETQLHYFLPRRHSRIFQ